MKPYQKLTASLFGLYIAALAFLCFGRFDNLQAAPTSILGIPLDKLVHFLMFLPYPALVCMTFGEKRPALTLVLAVVTGAATAILTEKLQGVLTTYRTADIYDFVADIISINFSALCIAIAELTKLTKHYKL